MTCGVAKIRLFPYSVRHDQDIEDERGPAVTYYEGAGYLERAFTRSLDSLLADMKEHVADVEFDTLVATGISGTVFAARVADALGKKLCIVRKTQDTLNHSGSKIEGYIGDRCLIVDDLMSSGKTVRTILERLGRSRRTTVVGVYMYGARYESDPYFLTAEELADKRGWHDLLGVTPIQDQPYTLREFQQHWLNQLTEPVGGWASYGFQSCGRPLFEAELGTVGTSEGGAFKLPISTDRVKEMSAQFYAQADSKATWEQIFGAPGRLV